MKVQDVSYDSNYIAHHTEQKAYCVSSCWAVRIRTCEKVMFSQACVSSCLTGYAYSTAASVWSSLSTVFGRGMVVQLLHGLHNQSIFLLRVCICCARRTPWFRHPRDPCYCMRTVRKFLTGMHVYWFTVMFVIVIMSNAVADLHLVPFWTRPPNSNSLHVHAVFGKLQTK